MGNCASVSVANITVYEELRSVLDNISEIVFKCRFIDDIFIIINSTSISDMDAWCNNLLKHSYLTFTYKHSDTEIDFLDLTIVKDSENNFKTKLYSKPTNKHKFLHFSSAHPKHLLKSLPYSSGLRIIRSCSEPSVRDLEFLKLFCKFEERNYPKYILLSSYEKLKKLERSFVLKPKKQLLISNLNIHNPSILKKYNISIEDVSVPIVSNEKVYLVFPFYKTVLHIGRLILQTICSDVNNCKVQELKNAFEKLSLVVSYKKSNALSEYAGRTNTNVG
jgi:hypothetical protein